MIQVSFNTEFKKLWITNNYTHILIKSLRFDRTFVSCFADSSMFPAVIISAFGELNQYASLVTGHSPFYPSPQNLITQQSFPCAMFQFLPY